MSWFSKRPPRHTHEWSVAAFDPGYTTTNGGENSQKHHLQFETCDCGERRLTGASHSPASYHTGIIKAKHRWKETNKLLLSDEADIYNNDYQCTQPPTGSKLGTYEYLPQTGIQKIISVLKSDVEFVELHNNHTLVAEAFAEFQTVVKLHEGL